MAPARVARGEVNHDLQYGSVRAAAVALLPIADECQGETTPSGFNGYARDIRKKASFFVAPCLLTVELPSALKRHIYRSRFYSRGRFQLGPPTEPTIRSNLKQS